VDTPRERDDQKQQQLEQHRVEHDGTHLTTDQAIKVDHTDDSLRAGERGPTLIEDFHFREKLTRFDHERIPERVVHARGSGAYGIFECTDALTDVTRAHFLGEVGRRTPVFVRFSTVVGFRGSADTVRDVRGFATKFYTEEGNFDLVGNNIPVFFIQDAIKFPDLVHSIKPEPHHQMPQASAAHDTFWDFVSLTPETMHTVIWVMSDHGVPRSYRMMRGSGVHTFRFVNDAGEGTFVKLHWFPLLGESGLVWDEAQKIAGKDPDFNRRDLWEAIESGDHPQWELRVQLIPEADEHRFDYDLLDPTKIVPEEDVPMRTVGRMTLDRNPDNFFAETEQVAFHPGNLVPGVDVTNDPLLQGRLFSYLDTQLIRLGGPNFAQLPVNRPTAEVHHHQRDGFGQHRIDHGRVSYHPSSLGGCPVLAGADEGAYVHHTERVEGHRIRRRSPSFDDHYTQPRMFWRSLDDPERQRVVEAYRFELGKVGTTHVRERMVEQLARIDLDLAQRVAEGIGVTPPTDGASAEDARLVRGLGMSANDSSAATRKVAVLAADGVDTRGLAEVRNALTDAGLTVEVVAPRDGSLSDGDGGEIPVDRTSSTTASVLYDGVLVAGGADSVTTVARTGELANQVVEAYKHAKPIGAFGEGVQLLGQLPLPGATLAPEATSEVHAEAGVVTLRNGGDLRAFADAFLAALAAPRHFDRPLDEVVA
jgi:catalase